MATFAARTGTAPFVLSVRHNIIESRARLTDIQRRQIPFATAHALTKTAQEVERVQKATMAGVFDRPKPYTINSIAVRPATKTRLTAEVFFREFAGKGIAGGKYLRAQVYGGLRRPKRSELLLRSRGILRPDEFIVPAETLPLDQFGNVPPGVMQRILSQLGAQADPRSNETARSRGRRLRRSHGHYFVGGGEGRSPVGSALPRGIYERRGGAIRGVLMFVRQPTYAVRYPFGDISARVSAAYFPVQFSRSLRLALATARR